MTSGQTVSYELTILFGGELRAGKQLQPRCALGNAVSSAQTRNDRELCQEAWFLTYLDDACNDRCGALRTVRRILGPT